MNAANRPVLIRADMVRARRRELTRSARQLEDTVGAGGGWLKALEENRNHRHVTVGELTTLAGELGLDPASLIVGDTLSPDLADDHPDSLHNDTMRLGRVLSDLRVQVSLTDLAAALGWTQTRLDAALDVLETRLPTVGLRLQRGSLGVQVIRNGQVDPAAEQLQSERISANGLNPVQATVLARVKAGKLNERTAAAALSKKNRNVALSELINAGLVKPPDVARGSKHTLTDRVRRSLLLDDQPPGTS